MCQGGTTCTGSGSQAKCSAGSLNKRTFSILYEDNELAVFFFAWRNIYNVCIYIHIYRHWHMYKFVLYVCIYIYILWCILCIRIYIYTKYRSKLLFLLRVYFCSFWARKSCLQAGSWDGNNSVVWWKLNLDDTRLKDDVDDIDTGPGDCCLVVEKTQGTSFSIFSMEIFTQLPSQWSALQERRPDFLRGDFCRQRSQWTFASV